MEYSFVTPATPQAPPAGPSAPVPSTPKTISARLKQRRVSLPSTQLRSHSALFRDEMALDEPVKNEPRDEPSARTTPASVSPVDAKPVKKQRKKWTTEETQMLVDGCNEWGVGNWKAILNDPRFVFQSRSPVDLKDRFRTYFPDAYRLHYPNAKTHLSSRVRSTLPDGTSIFEKTRSKKRRPFSKEEDEALRRGYEQHGTVWATIVKDPVFQQRRSTDLRDRFRNAFPDLYQQAGYKPRPARKTQKARTSGMYTDESGPSASAPKVSDSVDARARSADIKPKPSRLRIVTRTPKKRGPRRGRKNSDDDDDDDESEDMDDEDVDVDDFPESEDDHPAPASNNQSPGNVRGGTGTLRQHVHASRATPQPSNPSGYVDASIPATTSESEDVDMSSPITGVNIELPSTSSTSFTRDLTPISPGCFDSSAQSRDSASLLEQPATATDDVSSVMSSHGFDSLIYPSGEADSTWLAGTAVTSPTTSECFLHPHHPRRDDCMDRIGKSAWATSDWLSGNTRLDNALSGALAFGGAWGSTTNSVVDRYNLYTSSAGVAAHERNERYRVRHR
ncbi:Meiotically up-regulated gene 152 protein [Rhizoctonia solani AG-1 IB]|uniref:Meiotically up-regulated gene 152 protein n=1 Tax=Thanatephorus cucumeris (strain AG1-IB / isolate 7/3/14) TaxID=1108050 RepID=M5BQ64_THACB|nr:Meiotically up-regulated gene 152 protein [Rhizoctonia solani AG-1 IB]